uniref:WH1 domain-containing protein n=1 Tax=Tetradesmus obliquus TaxID=3088 RepID=A0A383W2F1_TETOB|eukprot:jgi/Sobl393_1/10169/SZX71817.1
MNMMVLKRIDAQIEEIIASAAHVCLYRMSVNEQQWQRKNIEGSLFLIKRRTQPRFQMLVLNKLSTDNYIETVHGGLEMETNPPYLMYTHGNDEIHGIWFYDESDLHHLAGLLQKILNQLPRPEDGAAAAAAAAAAQQQQQHHQPAPLPAVQEPLQPPAHAAAAAGEGDAFWDRSVHVTEENLPASQQLVPNSSLLSEPSAGAPGGGAMGGLQGLLKAAQQKHNVAQRASSASSSSQQPHLPAASSPIPNSSSMPADAAAPAPPSMLLTPAFFEQQKAKQQQAAPAPAAAPAASPVPAPAAASSSSNTSAAAQQPAAAVNGGSAASGSALHQLLSRAAKQTPSGPNPSAAAAAAAGGSAGARGQPQPPIGVLSPEAIRDKVKTALIRLANNDAFVDSLAQELKTVGLLQ